MVRYVMITQITHAQVNVFLQIWFHFRMKRCHSLSEVKAKSAYEPSDPSVWSKPDDNDDDDDDDDDDDFI